MSRPGESTPLHIVIVEAYEGYCEFNSDDPSERRLSRAIGLPLEELQRELNCRFTVLGWEEWYELELQENILSRFATRPVEPVPAGNRCDPLNGDQIRYVRLPCFDPAAFGGHSEGSLGSRSHGLINDAGYFFFLSFFLEKALARHFRKDPFDIVVMPMWGGLGYVSQLARATEVSNMTGVRYAVVVTDSSSVRTQANQEGLWTRHAAVRRQMEDVSLALADQIFIFGARGREKVASTLGKKQRATLIPRHLPPEMISAIETVVEQKTVSAPSFFLHEPLEAASGALAAIDAINALFKQDLRLHEPVVASGPEKTFAPMKPGGFKAYWTSRGFVKDMIHANQWQWANQRLQANPGHSTRIYPSHFEYLPDVWSELSRGANVMLSPASIEGLAPGHVIPKELLLTPDNPALMARQLKNFLRMSPERIQRLRQTLCQTVVTAHNGEKRRRTLQEGALALRELGNHSARPRQLDTVGRMLLDRRLSTSPDSRDTAKVKTSDRELTLTAVVISYQMGKFLEKAVKSIWQSRRQPDQLLVVDDGSTDEETLRTLSKLQRQARRKSLPLSLIQHHNCGLAAARNTGLLHATGDLITFLDGDDLVTADYYESACKLMGRYPRLGGVSAWADIFGENVPAGYWNAPLPELPLLLTENSVAVPCVMRTRVLRQLGGYDTHQRYNYEDWELSLRFLAKGWPIIIIPRQMIRYRVRTDSMYRSMSHVQNQVMRELLLHKHRSLVDKFGYEFSMLLEDQLMRFIYADRDQPHRYLNLWLDQRQNGRTKRSKAVRGKQRIRRLFVKVLKG